MQKRFCDLCGKPADVPDKITFVFSGKVNCDKKAKIQVRLTTGFVDHSTGFGGPPDFCAECLGDITHELLCNSERIRNNAMLTSAEKKHE